MKNCILRGYIYWVISLVGTVFVSIDLRAEVHIVPDDYNSIQHALNASVNLDTIRVRPGIYHERIIFPSANIVVISDYVISSDSSDLLNTVIDASSFANTDTSAVVTFVNENTHLSELKGFTLRGGRGTLMGSSNQKLGGGVYILNSSPIISHNIITEDSAIAGAIYCDNGYPTISHNSIYNNWAGNEYLCIITGDGNHPIVFEWNDISQNHTLGACIVEVDYCLGAFRYNSFHDTNIPFNWLVSLLQSDLDFVGNSFERIHGSSSNVPMVLIDYMVGTIQDNTFTDCVLSGSYALFVARSNFSYPQVINRNLFENLLQPASQYGQGAGIFIEHPSIEMHENTFINCNGYRGASVYLSLGTEGCDVDISRNLFLNNSILQSSGCGGIYLNPYYSVGGGRMCRVSNNWFQGNSPKAVTQFDSTVVWDISNNYWGDPSGPYHPVENPTGQGDTVDVSCHVTPWLTEPPALDANPQPRSEAIPDSWTLEKIYPNPFNSSVNIKLTSPTTISLQVTIYDITGRRVKDLWQGVVPARGNVALQWDGAGDKGPLSSGVYFITAVSQSKNPTVKTQKAILMR